MTWVKVKTDPDDLIAVELFSSLYDRHNCLSATGVYQATPGEESGIPIANFILKLIYITEGQDVAKTAEQPVTLMKSTITHCEMLGIVPKFVYNTRNNSTRDKDIIKKHLAEAIEATVIKVNEIHDADNVKLCDHEKYHPQIQKMLRKHNDLS